VEFTPRPDSSPAEARTSGDSTPQVFPEAADPTDHPANVDPAEIKHEIPMAPAASSSDPAGKRQPAWRTQLDLWLSGAPIEPTTPSPWRRLVRWCATHRLMAAVLVVNLVMVVGGALLITTAYLHASIALKTACLDRRDAEEQCERARAFSAVKMTEAAEQHRRAQSEKQARLVLEAALHGSEERRQDLERQLTDALKKHVDSAREVRLMIAQALADDAAQRINAQPMESLVIATTSARAALREGVSPSLGLQATLRDAMAKVGAPGVSVPSNGLPSMALSPRGRWLTTGTDSKTLRLWSPASKDLDTSPWELPGCRDDVLALAFDAQGQWLAAATSAQRVLVWQLEPANPPAAPRTFENSLRRLTAITISPKGRWLAVCGKRNQTDDCCVLLWDLASADRVAPPRLLTGHRETILASTFSQDERWLITAGEDKTVRLWDTNLASPANSPVVLEGHQGWVDSLAVTHNGRWLISGSTDGAARLWKLDEIRSGTKPIVLSNRPSWITSMAVSDDDRWLATGHFDNTILLWDLTASDPGSRVIVLAGHTDHVRTVAFAPNGQSLISAAQDKTIRLWNLAQCDPAPRTVVLATQEEPVDLLTVTADSRWLVAVSDCSTKSQTALIRLWALGTTDLVQSAQLVATRRLPLPQRTRILEEAAARSTQLR
jgi:WD40 repeat protein